VSPLSIIIPTLGNWEALENTLVSVLQNRPARSEILVVHSRPYSDPYDLKEEVKFVDAPSTSRLVDLMNLGMLAAESELLHLLVCGAVVDDGWAAAAARHFADLRVAAVAPLVLDVDSPSCVLTAGCLWLPEGYDVAYECGGHVDDVQATNRHWVGPDVAAAFYRRSALSEVGSLDASMSPRFAAIDLALRIRQAGHRTVLEKASRVMVDPPRLTRDGPFTEAWQRERLFWRQAREQGWLRSMAAHGRVLIAAAIGTFPRWRAIAQAAGRVVGACDRRPPRLQSVGAPTRAQLGTIERRLDAPHSVQPSQWGAGAAKAGKARSRTG
jgi:hypothetical protein